MANHIKAGDKGGGALERWMDGSGARAPERRPSWREENQADWRAEARVSCAAKRC